MAGTGWSLPAISSAGLIPDVCYLDLGKRSKACEHNLAALRHAAVSLHPFQCREDLEALAALFGNADVIIDALLGTGGRGAVKEPLATCIRMANATKAKIIAADIPTPGMRSDRICAFHRAKTEGAIVVDIGIPLEAECTVGPGELTLLPARGKKAHKGAGGEVLVIGGGPYQGAPYLAGLGALRAGADIVRIASPAFEPIPDLIYERLEGKRIGMEHTERLIALAEKADVVVCGNGLGAESHAVVEAVAPHCKKAVFDADALRLPLPYCPWGDNLHAACRGICTDHRKNAPGRYVWPGPDCKEGGHQGHGHPERSYRYHYGWHPGPVQPDRGSGDDRGRDRGCAGRCCRGTPLPPSGIRGCLHCRICQREGGRFRCGCRTRRRDARVGYCRQDPVGIVQERCVNGKIYAYTG